LFGGAVFCFSWFSSATGLLLHASFCDFWPLLDFLVLLFFKISAKVRRKIVWAIDDPIDIIMVDAEYYGKY